LTAYLFWACNVSQNCSVYLENTCPHSKISPLLFLVFGGWYSESKGEDDYFRVEGDAKTGEKLLKQDGQNQDRNRLKRRSLGMICRGVSTKTLC